MYKQLVVGGFDSKNPKDIPMDGATYGAPDPAGPSRRQFATWLGSAALAGLGACSRDSASVKIGVAQPLSGDSAQLGQDMLNGVLLAVNELNTQTKTNRAAVKFEVVAKDDKGDTKTAVQVAQQLVAQGVVAVIGHLNSDQSIAAAPIYAAANIPQLCISTNPRFTALGLKTALRMVTNDAMQATAMAQFASTQFKSLKYALLDDGTGYGKELIAGVIAALKKNPAIETPIVLSLNETTEQFTEVAADMKRLGVGVIITTLSDFQNIALITALEVARYTDVAMLGSDTIKTIKMLTGTGALRGLYCTSPILEPKEFYGGKQFLEKYRGKYNTAPAYAGHYAYDGMYVLAQAIEKCGSTDPQKITQTLSSIDGNAPVTGSMRWNSMGEPRYGVVGIYRALDGRWESLMLL